MFLRAMYDNKSNPIPLDKLSEELVNSNLQSPLFKMSSDLCADLSLLYFDKDMFYSMANTCKRSHTLFHSRIKNHKKVVIDCFKLQHSCSDFGGRPFFVYLIEEKDEAIFIAWLNLRTDSEINLLKTTFILKKIAEKGALNAIKAVINKGIIDEPTLDNDANPPTTALYINAENYLHYQDFEKRVARNVAISRLLIDNGSNVNFIKPTKLNVISEVNIQKISYEGFLGTTALMHYSLYGNLEIVDAILKAGGAKTINVRDFDLINFCNTETEESIYGLQETRGYYRFNSALSQAFITNAKQSYEVMQLLIDHNADLSIFYDDEYYKPILICAIGEFIDKNSVKTKSELYKTKAQLLLKIIQQRNLHLTHCKKLYEILTGMISENGYQFGYSWKRCIIS